MSFASAKNYECVRVRRSAGASGPEISPVDDGQRNYNVGPHQAGRSTMASRWEGDIPVSTIVPDDSANGTDQAPDDAGSPLKRARLA